MNPTLAKADSVFIAASRALLNRCVGDVVTVQRPAGETEFEILEIDWSLRKQSRVTASRARVTLSRNDSGLFRMPGQYLSFADGRGRVSTTGQ